MRLPVYFLHEPERKKFKPVSQHENQGGEGGAKERQATVTLQYVLANT